MDTDQNLLVGVLALQTDLIDPCQFVEACTLWTACKDRPMIDLLVEQGWLEQPDKTHLEYLAKRRLQQHGACLQRGLAAVSDDVKRSLAAIDDVDIQRSLSNASRPESPQSASTMDFAAHSTVDGFTAQIKDHYKLRRMLARGGIGQIWLAHDNCLERSVALKELRAEHENDSATTTRFVREARITSQLQHPGVAPIYELAYRDADQKPFYTMRLVEGPTLAESVNAFHQRRSAREAEPTEMLDLLNAFVAVCNTIAYGHSRGVLHRDIKGQNVVLGDFGEVIVLDWGLAKLVQSVDDEVVEPESRLDEAALCNGLLTVHGQTLGTPAYMSPEQAAGRLDELDHRTDVYSLGAMLYEILTGQPPFYGVDTQELLHKVRHEDPKPPRELWPEVPLPLEVACLRALAKDPRERFRSARDLAQTVERWQETQRKEAEEALKTSEALYHSLVETIPMNVWRKDVDGRFTFANQGFCRASGRTIENLVGQTDFDIFPRELAEKYRHDDERVMTTGEILDATEDHMTGGGEKLYVRVIKLPIRDARGQVVGTQGIFWDVSDVKRLEFALHETRRELAELRKRLPDANVPDATHEQPGHP